MIEYCLSYEIAKFLKISRNRLASLQGCQTTHLNSCAILGFWWMAWRWWTPARWHEPILSRFWCFWRKL